MLLSPRKGYDGEDCELLLSARAALLLAPLTSLTQSVHLSGCPSGQHIENGMRIVHFAGHELFMYLIIA